MSIDERRSSLRRGIVGLDASRAVTGAPTGTEYYSRALIAALLKLDSPYFFRLYTRTSIPGDSFPSTSNYEVRAIPFLRFWTHLRLSYEMLTRAPDALFVPAHVLPLIHPRNSIVTVHDLGYCLFPDAHPLFQRTYLDLSTRWNVRRARWVIADSYATRNDIVKFYDGEAEKIRVVYPAFDSEIFRPVSNPDEIERVRSKYGLASPFIISVGTVQPRKNYARLIEASATLAPEYICVIVGKKGWVSDSTLARVRELNAETRVRFLDYVPIEDLPALYTGARLAVLPSLYEGFGLTALEAQACGTPLVCSNSSSLPEVAGEGAIYFDPQRVSDMALALRVVSGDDWVREALAARGRKNLTRFSWKRAAQEILKLFGENLAVS